MDSIYYVVVAIGSVAALVLWLLRRYVSIPRQVRKLREQVDEITTKIIQLEKAGRTPANIKRLAKLYVQRKLLNRKLQRLRTERPCTR